jgi:chromate transporter
MMALEFSAWDWLALFGHFLTLSLLAIGGAITTAPDMHRILVDQSKWLTDAQFNASIALAQAAPGPNVLFVALMGWHVGLNTQWGHWGALLGVAVTMLGILIPSTTLTWFATRWAHRNQDHIGVRAFKTGMAPIVVGVLIATGVILATANTPLAGDWQAALAAHWRLWALSLVTALLVWKTKLHLLVLLGAGALAGGLGLV